MLRSFGRGRDMVDDARRGGYVGCKVSILVDSGDYVMALAGQFDDVPEVSNPLID